MKTCSKCRQEKALSEFGKCSKNADGLRYECKECKRAEDRAYAALHTEERVQKALAWAKANPERHRENTRRHARARRARDPQGENARARERYRRHWEKIRSYEKAYAQRKRNGGRLPTDSEIRLHQEIFGTVCIRCGSEDRVVLDHVIPLSKEGTNSIVNRQPLCHSCNSSKGAKETDYRRLPEITRLIDLLTPQTG